VRGTLPRPTLRLALLAALGLLPPIVAGSAGIGASLAWDGLLLLLFALDALLAPGPGALRARRSFRDPLSAFAPNRIALRLESAARRPLRLELADAPPASFEAVGHVRRAVLPAGGALDLSYDAVPRERGAVRFGELWLRSPGPLRLATRRWSVPLAQEGRVYPDLRSLALPAGASEPEGGRLRRTSHLEGREFESLRPYLVGDDVRSIDWKATARRGSPIVRQWQPERNQVVWLLLDCGRLLAARQRDGRTALDRAVDAALAVARAAVARGDRVGAVLFGATVERIVLPGSGRAQLGPLAEALHAARSSPVACDWAAAFDALDARQRRRALVLVFTDLADPDTSALLIARAAQLRRRHLVLVAAPGDSETAAVAAASPRAAEEAYMRAAAERILEERDVAIRRLAAAGVQVESSPAAGLARAVVGRYLEIKGTGAL
jgi:uncharacterized protein (DUF58 family)